MGITEEKWLVPSVRGTSWFAFYTRSRCERKVATLCEKFRLPYCLPLQKHVDRRRKKSRAIEKPMFASYVFGHGALEDAYEIMGTRYVVRAIKISKVEEAQFLAEMRNIMKASYGPAPLDNFPCIKKGRWVRILKGPLAGVVGRIARRKETFRVVLNLTLLGHGVGAEVDIADVELVDDPLNEPLTKS